MAQITYQPLLIYGLLALAVMLPMLAGGYIFALDMAFTPSLRMPEHMSSSYLFYAALHYLNFVIPSQILQKLLLLGILLLSGLDMHYLVRHIQHTKNSKHQFDAWTCYIAGALYMINPFTYSRFMAGQYAVLLGYALLPFVVRAALQFFAVPTMRRAFTVCAWTVAISIVSVHTLGLVLIIVLSGLAVHAWRHRSNATVLGRYLSLGLLSAAIFVLASGYWLFPLLAGASNQGQAIANFSANDRTAFSTVGQGIGGKLSNIVQLQGFWAEGQGLYLLPADQLPGWAFVVLGVWLLIGIGVVWLWRRQRAIAVLFVGVAIVAIAVAAAGLPDWPVARGYREPHKFVALMALAYALFAGLGAGAVLGWAQRRGQLLCNGLILAVVMLPVLFTPTMFWACSGQLVPRQYPADWFAVNNYLNQDRSDFSVLFVPWHLYMHFPFAGRVIVNPADKFFDKPTLVSNELEFAGASPTFPDQDKTHIGELLARADGVSNLGYKLRDYRIKYILLAKTFDYKTYYDYLDRQADLQLVTETPNLKLYRSLAYE